jgi:hypothetical protein
VPLTPCCRSHRQRNYLAQGAGCRATLSCSYDFCVLSLFTGSCLVEYGQSGLPNGSPSDGWNAIPDSPDVPTEWRGMPMAFIASDFSYFDKKHMIVPHLDALANPARVRQVHIRFRYDKSALAQLWSRYGSENTVREDMAGLV